MYAKFRLFVCGTSVFVFGGVFPVSAETLQEAVRSAISNHPSVVAAKASHKAADRDVRAEVSGYFPEISVSASGGRVYQDNATSRGLVTERGAAYSGYGEGALSMSQMVFDGMETHSRVAAAKARLRSYEDALGDVEEEIALRTAQSYLDVMRARQALILIQQQSQGIKDYYTRIQAMFDEGVVDESELQQARDVGMIVDGALADYEAQLSSAQAGYYEATGGMPEDRLVRPSSLDSIVPDAVQDAIQIAKANHFGLKSAVEEAKAAGLDIDVARADYFPDISGELSILKSDKKDVIGGESEDQRALLRMNWQFSTGGKQIAYVDKKKYKHEEAKARIHEIEREVERDVYQTYADYRAAEKKRKLSVERVKLNEKLFGAYETQFEGSRVSLLHVMRAQSQLFNARLEATDNDFRFLSAQYAVLTSMGYLKSALDASEMVRQEYNDSTPAPAHAMSAYVENGTLKMVTSSEEGLPQE